MMQNQQTQLNLKVMKLVQMQACRSISTNALLVSMNQSLSIGLDLDDQLTTEDAEAEDDDS